MSPIRTRRRAGTALAAALLMSLPVVAACGSSVEQAAEQAAEQALGGDVNIEGDSLTMTDEEGNEVSVGEGIGLPDQWPSAVPPLEGGTLGAASANADGTASAMWTTDQAPADAVAAYSAALEGAGFTSTSTSVMGDLNIAEYAGNGLTVGVSAVGADGMTTVIITVNPG